MNKFLALLFFHVFVLALPAQSNRPPLKAEIEEGRQNLVIPDTIWNTALSAVGYGGKTLGYTADEMTFYNPDEFNLRQVWQLFRNVRTIPRFSGQLGQYFMDSVASPSALVQRAFILIDAVSARNLPLSNDSLWYAKGEKSLPNGQSALDSMMNAGMKSRPNISQELRKKWAQLPDHVKRFVYRIFQASTETRQWLNAAFPQELMLKALGVNTQDSATLDRLYKFATKPWTEERLGQPATSDGAIFEMMRKTDRKYLAFASTLLMASLQSALEEFRIADSLRPVARMKIDGLSFPTNIGTIRISGTGRDTLREQVFFSLDLGGDDYYIGRQAVNRSFAENIALVVDMDGNDTYNGADTTVSMACGVFGIGILADVKGDDSYRNRESGLGSAWFGTGVLMDFAGNDDYTTDKLWGQGAAHVGVGMLMDFAGNDTYTCAEQSQGLGSTLGAGVLFDVSGNDRYVARDDGNPTPIYYNQSVAMSQGVGFGRRADLGDGHSLSGGFGVLIDGAGDDYYSAPVWAQGAGYWWAVGILEDRGGNDTYRSGKYSLGSAAHFAIGCKVDLSGNDNYAIGYNDAVNQYTGHARDGSIGISIDGDGDDNYFLKAHSGGSGDLGSIGVFWDRRGNDSYSLFYDQPSGGDNGWADTSPLGTATKYTPFYSFRDDVKTIGIFLDTGGDDTYTWKEGGGKSFYWDVPPANNTSWRSNRSKISFGFGQDIDWFFPAKR